MLYEIHMLKHYPPTNLNRDETGSPKSCTYGGVMRGRISSQCLKRSWRSSPLFQELLGENATRSRSLPVLVEAELIRREIAPELIEVAVKKTTGIANESGKESDDRTTSQIVFFSPIDVEAVTDMLKRISDESGGVKEFAKVKSSDIAKKFKDVKLRPITLDIALFGRMVTSNAFANVEAAIQVAHGISTHAVNMESDYFTAVDDLIAAGQSDATGAAMIGDIDFNSCCYYHYIAIDVDQLKENLAHSPDAQVLIEEVLPAFVQIMAFSNPSGKQNTFAGHVLPDLMAVEVKQKKIPLSYAGAFAKPVRADSRHPIGLESAKALVDEIDCMDKAYGLPVLHRGWFCPRSPETVPADAENMASLDQLVKACTDWARE